MFKFGSSFIGENQPVYFIADIAANHDGELKRAKELIVLAKESGADAVKFQHHDVNKYVSDKGFIKLGSKLSHQTKWQKSIYDVYKDAEVPLSWTEELKALCNKIGIEFFTTPYDLDLVDKLEKDVPGFKIGSGDINWNEMLEKVSKKDKPILFATGAATMEEVINAYNIISHNNAKIVLMQCNTNYTGGKDNFKYIHLNVLKTYNILFPNVILGLSDHTPGSETVLGAIALGAKVIEKHFTDDNNRQGPDHPFSMNPEEWYKMVTSSRLLEEAMGNNLKKVELNERETVILQRRCIRLAKDVKKGTIITRECIEYQRPAPINSIKPNEFHVIEGMKINKDLEKGEALIKEYF